MQGIKVDFITNTIIITKEFAALASDPTSEEYVTLNLLREENPKMKIATRSRKKSSKERNQNKGLTYKFMRKFIATMDEKNLEEFCRTIQSLSPVNGYVTPIPEYIPGYEDQVIMAGGTFIEGSTIELSADVYFTNGFMLT